MVNLEVCRINKSKLIKYIFKLIVFRNLFYIQSGLKERNVTLMSTVFEIWWFGILYSTSPHFIQHFTSFYTALHLIFYSTSPHFIQHFTSFYAAFHLILCNTSPHFIQHFTSFYTALHLILYNNSPHFIQHFT